MCRCTRHAVDHTRSAAEPVPLPSVREYGGDVCAAHAMALRTTVGCLTHGGVHCPQEAQRANPRECETSGVRKSLCKATREGANVQKEVAGPYDGPNGQRLCAL